MQSHSYRCQPDREGAEVVQPGEKIALILCLFLRKRGTFHHNHTRIALLECFQSNMSHYEQTNLKSIDRTNWKPRMKNSFTK